MFCLNPCSNGIWSLTDDRTPGEQNEISLNPCSNGIWSLTQPASLSGKTNPRLNPCSNGIWSLTLTCWYMSQIRIRS